VNLLADRIKGDPDMVSREVTAEYRLQIRESA
jgi:hypothetical protein